MTANATSTCSSEGKRHFKVDPRLMLAAIHYIKVNDRRDMKVNGEVNKNKLKLGKKLVLGDWNVEVTHHHERSTSEPWNEIVNEGDDRIEEYWLADWNKATSPDLNLEKAITVYLMWYYSTVNKGDLGRFVLGDMTKKERKAKIRDEVEKSREKIIAHLSAVLPKEGDGEIEEDVNKLHPAMRKCIWAVVTADKPMHGNAHVNTRYIINFDLPTNLERRLVTAVESLKDVAGKLRERSGNQLEISKIATITNEFEEHLSIVRGRWCADHVIEWQIVAACLNGNPVLTQVEISNIEKKFDELWNKNVVTNKENVIKHQRVKEWIISPGTRNDHPIMRGIRTHYNSNTESDESDKLKGLSPPFLKSLQVMMALIQL